MDALRYSDDVEQPVENEAQLTDEIVQMMGKSQVEASDKHRHGIRDAHAKSHGFLKGTLTVRDGLSPELSQGLFASPAQYPVVIRLSSAPGDIHSDKAAAPKGFAIKIVGVPGERILPEDRGGNQDFLLVNIPSLAFGDVGAYKKLLIEAEKNKHEPEFLHRAMTGVARGIAEVTEAAGLDPGAKVRAAAIANTNLLGETYHSMAALRFGDYVAKVSVAPKSDNVRALTGKLVEDIAPSGMRDLIVEHFKAEGAEYEVRVQLCRDLKTMPVEDASVLWREDESPQQPVATITIAPQDAYSPARRIYGDDVLAYNPWHGLAAHRPLGSIMRVRLKSYESSTAFRHAMNLQPRIEPATIDEVPN